MVQMYPTRPVYIISVPLLLCLAMNISASNAAIENQLTTWRECSPESNKDWSICLGPTSDYNGLFFHYWYCPTVEDVHDEQMICITCPGIDSVYSDCQVAIQSISELFNISGADYNTEESLFYCEQMCASGVEGDACFENKTCNPGYFCDFSVESNSGICKSCPYNISTCFQDDFISSLASKRECYNCQLACTEVSDASILLDENELSSTKPISNAIQSSFVNASGPLIDCSNLILHDVYICQGAENHVCLVNDFTSDVLFWDLSQKAENNNCSAIIMFPSGGSGGQHSNDELSIPYVFVSDEYEKNLLKSSIGQIVNIEVRISGSACMPSWNIYGMGDVCNEKLPCRGENEYCDFRKSVQDGKYIEGWCSSCPDDPAGCFFDRNSGSNVKGLAQVQSCASTCMAELSFDQCKFCPDDITAFDFGVENKEDQCHFCPGNDMEYPERHVSLFGPNVTCQNMQAFFERLEVHKDSHNCLLALKMNHICGCAGRGYAGTESSPTKQAALVWLPRVSAMLSFMVMFVFICCLSYYLSIYVTY